MVLVRLRQLPKAGARELLRTGSMPPMRRTAKDKRLKYSLRIAIPKDPCTFIVYTWALKLLYRNPFKA